MTLAVSTGAILEVFLSTTDSAGKVSEEVLVMYLESLCALCLSNDMAGI